MKRYGETEGVTSLLLSYTLLWIQTQKEAVQADLDLQASTVLHVPVISHCLYSSSAYLHMLEFTIEMALQESC